MGKRGPKGKSPELESLQGFPGRRKARTQASLKVVDAPAIEAGGDIQDERCDSRFVQPPGYLGKRERAVWGEIFSGPNAALWYKFSDHNVIARYCVLSVIWRQQTKTPPAPSYEVHRTKVDKDGKPAGLPEILIKRNPAFDQMLALARELRSIENDVGLNPDARLMLERKGLASGTVQPAAGSTDKPASQLTSKPAGPVGILRSREKMN